MEAQIDRLVGPTHHFGGLGVGNLASQAHRGDVSNPRAAALQGLDKLARVARLGVPQFILPPQPRPRFDLLRCFGFSGSDAEIMKQALQESPILLSAAMSCSGMWTANAATVSPSWDSPLDHLTVTVANLDASLHRSIEPEETHHELRRLLPAETRLNAALPGGTAARDEGAANHMRIAGDEQHPGLHLFVYGDGEPRPTRHLARQSFEASRAISRLHQIPEENVFFLQQHPAAIDAGAFHNDVVAASHGDLLLHHELAFYRAEETLDRLAKRFQVVWGRSLRRISVGPDELTLDEAVGSYLFNSQIVSPPDDSRALVLICPVQVQTCARARSLVERWRDGMGIFSEVQDVELRQSMSAGGGPACLRLRVPVTPRELAGFNQRMRWTESLGAELRSMLDESYATSVTLSDLVETDFIREAERVTQRLRIRLLGKD